MQARLFLLCEFLRVNFTVNVPSFKDKSHRLCDIVEDHINMTHII